MKKALYLIVGVIIGASIGIGTTSYAAVKQFILTEFNSPVVVNGVVYKDVQNPILNYNGKTYIPLSKIGDLTGVNYKWNAEKKQVEIGSTSQTGMSTSSGTDHYVIDNGRVTTIDAAIAEREAIENFTKNTPTVIEEKAGLVEEDGTTVLYIKNNYGSDVRLVSEDDVNYVTAKIKKQPLPPGISDGWISEGLLKSVYGPNVLDQDLSSASSKKFNEITYYKIDDLINLGVIKIK
ncbi:MAG: hypothetical protein KID09_08810 [Paenibacillus macerans]|uniref:stalk domain-containing protein n=1 Tax=Paenibacillus macerans TaxID=44252 RepID=UPI0024309E81|nr:stalk domain-containing protein [Paenibacillus macerans]MBS5910735.1 hypothetical protein [Paenibacillus macerans]